MNKEIYDQVLEAIKDRQDWETKQSGFYRLRHRQVGRSVKPYIGAPDMRYGLADTLIEKIKPLYVGQLFANDNLATFVSTCKQDAAWSTAAQEWFDYQLKQCSNFQTEIFIAIDKHLEGGLVPLKVYWNPDKGQVMFDSCNPMHVIVPEWTEDIQCADWLVHVMHVSEAQYRRNPLYTQDDDFIKRIKGQGSENNAGLTDLKQSKAWREGLTYGTEEQIVLWECYRRESADKQANWMVETISPLAGCDEPVRAMFGHPYNHGLLPFFVIPSEIIDKGYYSPRGITEVTATHEMSLNKTWNGKLQHLDFHGTPTYEQTGTQTIGNTSNYRSSPGGILPPGLRSTTAQGAPLDFEQEMQFTRALAEDRCQVPDLGSNEHLTGRAGGKGDPTATQINAIVGQSNQSGDMRSRTFRMALGQGFKMAWLLYVQFKKEELDYLQQDTLKQVPQEAIHEKYIITPSGSPDSWNKGATMQRRLALYQLMLPNPFVPKDELTKWLFEAEDPNLIKRLFRDPGLKAKTEAEAQALECVLMLNSWPAEVEETDDDKTHLITMAQFVERRMSQQEPVTPELARLLLMHGSAHTEALSAKKDPAMRQITQQMIPIIQMLSQIANQPEQPSNILQMPGTQQPQGGIAPAGASLPAGGPATAPGQDQGEPAVDTAVKVGNMLTNMVKAGIPVTHAEINKVMQEAGLAPLSMNPIGVSELNGTDGQPMLTNGEDTGEVLNTGRPDSGMIMPPPQPGPAPVNVINIASEKTITVRREKDGSLTGTVKEVMPKR